MEPFRWLGDVTTIEAFESDALDVKDFYFKGDDYRYHIEIEAKRRFLELLKNRFNSGVKYRGKAWKWDTVILNKTQELARFLQDKSRQVEFSLSPVRVYREAIQRSFAGESLSARAKKLGIGKGTLNNLRENAEQNEPFRIYKPIMSKLVASENHSLASQESVRYKNLESRVFPRSNQRANDQAKKTD